MANLDSKASKVDTPKEGEYPVSEVLVEIGKSIKDLIQSEIHLARAEMKGVGNHLSRRLLPVVAFGTLVIMSILPFLAFLVIGLGNLMGGAYAFSSLIIAVVCAVIGGAFAYRSYQKLKEEDWMLPRTRESLRREFETVAEKTKEVTDHAGGEVKTIQDSIKRRAS